MSQNPLLGKNISLISKKHIRYEGVLYSINEQNATVALQNVRSFGTEGREVSEPGAVFVAPEADSVHPFLLFRGQDIKDLHVHEAAGTETPAAAAAVSSPPPPPPQAGAAPVPAASKPVVESAPKPVEPAKQQYLGNKKESEPKQQPQQQQQPKQPSRSRRQRSSNVNTAVGTGASLLKRTERGVVNGGMETPKDDYDFQSHIEEFKKEMSDEDEAGDIPDAGVGGYDKDDFFDSISCDALDKQTGADNRLRGSTERTLNTETFGAIALNSQRRRRGRGGGRGRGRGGRGRGGRGGYRGGQRQNRNSDSSQRQSATSTASS